MKGNPVMKSGTTAPVINLAKLRATKQRKDGVGLRALLFGHGLRNDGTKAL